MGGEGRGREIDRDLEIMRININSFSTVNFVIIDFIS
jgi:hypothetical protein